MINQTLAIDLTDTTLEDRQPLINFLRDNDEPIFSTSKLFSKRQLIGRHYLRFSHPSNYWFVSYYHDDQRTSTISKFANVLALFSPLKDIYD